MVLLKSTESTFYLTANMLSSINRVKNKATTFSTDSVVVVKSTAIVTPVSIIGQWNWLATGMITHHASFFYIWSRVRAMSKAGIY